MAATSYQHLTDVELIKYAMDDAPVDSLAHLVASRYEDNITDIVALEESQAEIVNDLERSRTEAISALQDEVDTSVKRIMWLEAALDRALLK